MTPVNGTTTNAVPARPANLLQAVFEAGIAAVVLVAADAIVRVVPFAAIAGRVQRPLRSSSSEAQNFAVRRVKWAVGAAHRRLPWIPCLATAIAANRLLAWRGVASELWLGVRPNERMTIDAHAWLVAEGRVVTGGAEKTSYQPLHVLVTAAAPGR